MASPSDKNNHNKTINSPSLLDSQSSLESPQAEHRHENAQSQEALQLILDTKRQILKSVLEAKKKVSIFG